MTCNIDFTLCKACKHPKDKHLLDKWYVGELLCPIQLYSHLSTFKEMNNLDVIVQYTEHYEKDRL